MAGGNGVWGIDIGQCGLKALRGTMSADGKLKAESFDYIEYPQILSQPEAKPDQLIREALKQFLSRNNVRGDKVAISVSGQSGLARFIKLPPVESKKIPQIVAYEAKQQIPFDLDEVVWDYQPMPGSTEEEGFALETEVGLFAMKRDLVLRAIQPLVDADVEIDFIQLAPLAIYNAVSFDQLHANILPEDEDDQPDSIVVVSLGTETSDLVVTNGFRVWQRSIPIGGNHFTKQLTKELKLTFAKAEQLKRNAREDKNAKKIIQAMRPTYSDLVTELQRSIGFFRSLDKKAKLTRVIVLGNAAKLPGLTQYLSKNLEMDVSRLKKFDRMTGKEVLKAQQFADNTLSFPVCYGLVLQGLNKSNLKTNLVPREILRARLIRAKKPWAAAIAATLLLGCAGNYFFQWKAWNAAHADRTVNNVSWKQAISGADGAERKSKDYIKEDKARVVELERLYELGGATIGSADDRLLWLELMKTIKASLPADSTLQPGEIKNVDERPLDGRAELYITGIRSQYFQDLAVWFNDEVNQRHADDIKSIRAFAAGKPIGEATSEGGSEDEDAVDEAPDTGNYQMPMIEGKGWVIEIEGHHFYTKDTYNRDKNYVRNTLIKALVDGQVDLPIGPDQMGKFRPQDLGILGPVVVAGDGKIIQVPNPKFVANAPGAPAAGGQRPEGGRPRSGPRPPGAPSGSPASGGEPPELSQEAYGFKVQFAWKQVSLSKRLENLKAATGDDGLAANP